MNIAERIMNLEGQTALITGAGRGIGKTIALKLAESGADIVLADMSPEVAEVRVVVESLGRKCLTFEADVTDLEAIETMVKKIIEELGSIHILINNAGITQDNLFMRMKPEQWSKVIDVNLNGVFNVTKAVIRSMVKQRTGKIINISSVVGFSGNPGQVNYSSTKSALVGFTKSLAREVGARGVTVNAVAPGFIDTAMTQALNESQQEAILQQIPLGRMGDANDIANAVAFLASEEASYITGTILHVNGGMY
jgi:3-oxoacyl-[acyl-carrier protein] reductase|tara:strand:+ start:113 stop:868 length:756 start_codon:yes stop_codon:yes gene_type:complete